MSATIQRRNVTFLIASGLFAAAWLASRGEKSPRFVVPEVDVAQAKAMMEAGAIVIDVRGKDAFDYRHLPPALLFSLAILRAGIPTSLASAQEQQIVVYCNDGHSTGTEAAARRRSSAAP